MKILVNRCIDRLRHQKNLFLDNKEYPCTTKTAIALEISPDQVLENQELADYIKSLFALLPPKQKIVFVLRDLENYETSMFTTKHKYV